MAAGIRRRPGPGTESIAQGVFEYFIIDISSFEILIVIGVETVAKREADESALKIQAAQNSIENDPNVRDLVDMFGAEVEQDSIRPVSERKN